MRPVAIALLSVLSAVFVSPSLARAEENIYAQDVADASHALQRAEKRFAVADADVQRAGVELPAARAAATRLRAEAVRREDRAERVGARASVAERAVRDQRARARAQVDEVRSALAVSTQEWRSGRAMWIAIAAMVLAGSGALSLFWVAASRGRESEAEAAWARRCAFLLGVSVAVYLSGVIAALAVADAWRFSWWPLTAVVVGLAGLSTGCGLGWRAPTASSRSRMMRMVVVPAAVLVLGGLVAGSVAVGPAQPRLAPLSSETVQLAEDAASDALMPPAVRALRRRANLLDARASATNLHASQAEIERDDLIALGRMGHRRGVRAQRDVAYWSDELESAQRNYDDYQQLIELTDSVGDYELPPSGSPPTTESFGSGSGSVGLCADGTLSDSIGRPGACSYHGGVR